MKMDRRAFLSHAAAAGLLLPATAATAEGEPKLVREDYAVARERFRTHLTQTGPSPDPPQPLSPPHGARRLDYRSGPLRLAAWVSENADASRPRPGVLVLHGGNALWPGHWDDLAHPFVKAGYVAMIPAMRGENGLPGSFSGFYDETADVLAAADVLRAYPGVDPARLYIAGHSVGGTLTLLAAMSRHPFRAAAAYAGNPDARAFFRHFPEDIRFDADDPQEFDMRSPVCFAGSFKCPVLMLHGSKEMNSDHIVRLTVSRARAAGLDVRRAIVEGDHSSAIPGESAEALRFFETI
jgi:dipeptidyl aminopeptidase/acylaminoacyl peptidase